MNGSGTVADSIILFEGAVVTTATGFTTAPAETVAVAVGAGAEAGAGAGEAVTLTIGVAPPLFRSALLRPAPD